SSGIPGCSIPAIPLLLHSRQHSSGILEFAPFSKNFKILAGYSTGMASYSTRFHQIPVGIEGAQQRPPTPPQPENHLITAKRPNDNSVTPPILQNKTKYIRLLLSLWRAQRTLRNAPEFSASFENDTFYSNSQEFLFWSISLESGHSGRNQWRNKKYCFKAFIAVRLECHDMWQKSMKRKNCISQQGKLEHTMVRMKSGQWRRPGKAVFVMAVHPSSQVIPVLAQVISSSISLCLKVQSSLVFWPQELWTKTKTGPS
ncbi:hypothetical protein BDZ97DRAFT_2045042, partial [Flammula alnicola]